LLPIREETDVFAVQLATFDEEVNARKLREQLLGDGEEAFISQYKQRGISGEKIRYRVAVGPMLSHTLAKEKRISYSQIYGVEAIVVAMTQ
jgi:cell division septation protein DedD